MAPRRASAALRTSILLQNGDRTAATMIAASTPTVSTAPATDRDTATRPWRRDFGPVLAGTARARGSSRDWDHRHRRARCQLTTVGIRCRGDGGGNRGGGHQLRHRGGSGGWRCHRRFGRGGHSSPDYRPRRLGLLGHRQRAEFDPGYDLSLVGTRCQREITLRNGSGRFLNTSRTPTGCEENCGDSRGDDLLHMRSGSTDQHQSITRETTPHRSVARCFDQNRGQNVEVVLFI